jgi:UDP-glucose 4-epimerase
LVFMSSIRAQAGASIDAVITEKSPPAPTDPYGRAKLAAEQDLHRLDLETVVLRPVVIVGPAAKGNLALLLKLADTALPLPFGALAARRSMVSLDDVVAATVRAIDDPDMAGKTIILADPEPLSLADMLRTLRDGLGRPARLFAFPESLLRLPFRLTGRTDLWDRIGGPMVAQPDAALRLGLTSRLPVREAMRQLAASHRQACQTAGRTSE